MSAAFLNKQTNIFDHPVPSPEFSENENPARTFEDVLSSISEIARVFLDERTTYGEMRTDIKKRMARARLYIVNGLTEFLTPEVVRQLEIIEKNKTKLTLDTTNALVALELGEDYDRYESAKFNAATSEKAFPMFQAELSGHQSKMKKDALDFENSEYAQRMTAQCDRPENL